MSPRSPGRWPRLPGLVRRLRPRRTRLWAERDQAVAESVRLRRRLRRTRARARRAGERVARLETRLATRTRQLQIRDYSLASLKAELAELRASRDTSRPAPEHELRYLFVMTYGRSGSTLLQAILNSIPGVLIRGENGGIVAHLQKFHEVAVAERATRERSDSPAFAYFGMNDYPASAPALSQEKLKNALRQHLGSSSWTRLARENPAAVAAMLDSEFSLVASLEAQRFRKYTFGELLVARAGTRVNATSAGNAGRLVEDRIEAIAVDLGLPYVTRGRFQGRHNRTAPCDLAVPGAGGAAQIVVAAKAFDSTGSKLTDAVREVEEMADVRKPSQFVMAVIDGIGWLSRANDLRKIHALWASGQIDGMYTLATLDTFRADLEHAARLRGLL